MPYRAPAMTPPRHPALRFGADIGGTFTDIVLLDPADGSVAAAKLLTTPDDPLRAVLAGLTDVLARAGRSSADVEAVVHGTTLATNAIIERRGARTALLTTAGFRDVLETGRELRYELYSLQLAYPAPLVPRRWRFPVQERIDAGGAALTPLDDTALDGVIDALAAERIESVAVCLLHSYANPMHERAIAAALNRRLPDVRVSLSSTVLPQIGEYPRASTTVVNAYVQPLMADYLSRMADGLQAMGLPGAVSLIASNGGTAGVQDAIDAPAALIESGPAAGITAAGRVASGIGCRVALAFDMGGTTAKLCLVRDGLPNWTSELEVARTARFQKGSGLPVALPSVDLIEIGAGGGSIARLDPLGLLEVGPESAGAAPGPACYGNGGTEPTVTDANLLLGYLNAGFFAGGSVGLSRDAAAAAMRVIAASRTVEDAAADVFEAVTGTMANAARVHAAEKGVDVRRSTIIAFGGAGPVHAWRIAQLLAVPTVVVPPSPGVLSAIGCALAPARCDRSHAYVTPLATLDVDRMGAVAASLLADADRLLEQAHAPREGRLYAWSLDMKCTGQRYVINVPLAALPRSAADGQALRSAFDERYRSHYGRIVPGVPAEIESVRLTATGPAVAIAALPGYDDIAPAGARRVRFGATVLQTPVHRRASLPPGARLSGPAVVEEAGSTTIVPPGAEARVDEGGNIHIAIGRA